MIYKLKYLNIINNNLDFKFRIKFTMIIKLKLINRIIKINK